MMERGGGRVRKWASGGNLTFYHFPSVETLAIQQILAGNWKITSEEAGTSFVCIGMKKVFNLPFLVQLRSDL